MKIRKIIKMLASVIAVVGLTMAAVSFAAPSHSETSSLGASATLANTKKFVKTKNKCSTCSCSGYWGYKHDNGTYEGACSNTDKWGHKCGHGPEKHGLRKW